jgi:hypothetical protein
MKNRYLGVIVFPVVAISVATVVVNGIGVLIAGGQNANQPQQIESSVCSLGS